jgi:hypothetical protein
MSHAFKNPDILEKLILFVEIDEIGSNYPKELFDPHGFDSSDYYDQIAREQALTIEERELEKLNRTSVQFVKPTTTQQGSGVPLTTTSVIPSNVAASKGDSTQQSSSSSGKRREGKSRWDQSAEEVQATQPTQLVNITTQQQQPPPSKSATTSSMEQNSFGSAYSEFA